jgi:hypothetical protein
MAKSSLVKLATGGKKTVPVKKEEKKVVEKKLTPDEERDLKAKERVKELLQGVDLSLEKKEDELLEMDEPQTMVEGSNWLQEQVSLLASENELLKIDLANAKEGYAKMFEELQRVKANGGAQGDSELMKGILTVFHELQSNYVKNPGNRQDGIPNFIIVPPAFLNRLIMFFPFLQQEKRF